ncbi:MAG TPA: hypothetical protein VKD72_03710, partial [Gemmataceae bacterium]|nr:hypothetical protein [Gemmataceae bacterium]
AFFRALSVDRDMVAASKNALVTLAAWAVTEGVAGRIPEARAIVRTGLDLAPNDARLRYARARVWAEHAQREFDRGGLEAGVAALRDAAADAPDGPFVQLQAWLVIRPGEPLVAAKKWEDAIALVEPLLTKVDPPACEELLRWRGGVFIRWANEEIAAGRFEKALEVVERGLKMHPKDGRFPDLLTAVARNWVQTAHAEKGEAAAREVVEAIQARGKNNPQLRPAARRAPYWLVIELQDAGKPEEARAVLAAAGPVVPGEVDANEVLRGVYDHWASALLEKGDYRGAFDVYVKAVDRLPDDPVVYAHLAYVVHRWIAAVEKVEGPEKVKELITSLRQEHPKLKHFIGVTPAAVWTSVRGLRDVGQYAEALDALDRFAELLTKTDEVREMYRHLYDRWADHHVHAKAPAFAVDVYELAIRRFPRDKHVGNNLAVVLQQWALALQADGREGDANAVLLRALIRFPDVPDVAEIARDHVPLLVQKLRNDGMYPDALAALDRHWDLLQELHGSKAEAERGHIGQDVYQVWAGGHKKKKKWENALEVYEKGMKHLPKERDLREQAAGVYDAWARTYWDKGKKDWDGGIAIYDRGIKRFPDSSLLKDNKTHCEEMKKRDKK